MRLCVSCVYWTLLLVSVVSSGLLFLIVASEGTHTSEKPRGIGQEDNVPLEDVSKESSSVYSDSLHNRVSDVRARPTVKTENEHLYPVENDGGLSGREIAGRESNIENNLNVLKQSLTQQPNLSQGISETGQAVVLTLVDTATAELQSLAEPRLSSDLRSRTLSKNTTLRTTSTGPIPATTTATTTTLSTTSGRLEHEQLTEQETEKSSTSSLPVVPLATESTNNVTKILSKDDEREINEVASQEVVERNDEVLIVRAEQRIIDDTTTRKPDEIQEDEVKDQTLKQEESSTASTELDDGAARAKLVGGSSEDSAAGILDGFVATGSSDHHHHEDIPSFSEWAQKRMEEAEKKKTHPNASIQNPGGPGRGLGGMKIRSKNYASPDCGAKIVAVNPEARSARSVLVSTRDEYMLNTCTSRVWFVVELCEAIQAKKIELANFELFSSSPKDFSVHVSDRFPTRDWSTVGQFTAKDQRDIQSFALQPHLFGKFIKVELQSHYGSEHFCPISLFRAYGTSEFEVLETETDHQESDDPTDNNNNNGNANNEDDDEDEALDSEGNGETRNLFGSARDAVLRIVKKAAEVLVKTGDPGNNNNITKIQESIEDSITKNSFANCMTPRYALNCPNCTDNRFAGVFELLNCRAKYLDDILQISWINDTLRNGLLCSYHGFHMTKLSQGRNETLTDTTTTKFHDNDNNVIDVSLKTKFLPASDSRSNLLSSMYKSEYIIALCNVIATKDGRLVLNTSYEFFGNLSVNSSTLIDGNSGNFDTIETNGNSRITTSSSLSCLTDNDVDSCKNFVTNGETKISKIQASSSLNEQQSRILVSPETTTTTTTMTMGTTTTTTTTTAASTTSPTTTTTATTSSESNLASQIKPTKALSRDDMRKDSSVPILEPSKDPTEESIQAEVLTTASPILNLPTSTTRITDEPLIQQQQNNVETLNGQIVETHVTVGNSLSRDNHDIIQENIPENIGTAAVRHENTETESKIGKMENIEQEGKLMSNDQMSLDSIFSDLKDLETDGGVMQSGTNQNANIVAQPTASSTPQQKESVFLRLSNRIKALERNMSLSGQYLEELSKRYKKQVEEMQRSLERATASMSEESRKGEERDLRRIDEITALRDEITTLTQTMEILLHDRNSWRSKLSTVCQHFVLVVVEIVVFMFVVSYCRRNSEFVDIPETLVVSGSNEITRRRSAGTMSNSCGTVKKMKKRRPSEITARIAGTYRDLMIDERTCKETRKDKKRKRRKRELNDRRINNGDTRKTTMSMENDIPGGTDFPSRRSSSTDPMSCHAKQLELCHRRKRPDSAPEYSGQWLSEQSSIVSTSIRLSDEKLDETISEITKDQSLEEMRETNFTSQNQEIKEVEKNTKFSFIRGGGGGILKAAKLSSPSFMKTALGSRSKRNSKITENIDNIVQLRSDNWEWYSRNSSNRSESDSPTSSMRLDVPDSNGNGQDRDDTKNGHKRNTSNESESSACSTTTTTSAKKKTTAGGLRKMVRKFF